MSNSASSGLSGPPQRPNAGEFEHGYIAYANGRCRCADCRAEWSEYNRVRRLERKAELRAAQGLVEGLRHGSPWTLTNHGCRCSQCVDAYRAYGRRKVWRRALSEGRTPHSTRKYAAELAAFLRERDL